MMGDPTENSGSKSGTGAYGFINIPACMEDEVRVPPVLAWNRVLELNEFSILVVTRWRTLHVRHWRQTVGLLNTARFSWVKSNSHSFILQFTRMKGRCRFLDKAIVNGVASITEIEETRTLLGLLPIFASTIMMNCCLAQLQTFTVNQGAIMDRNLTDGFILPTPSLAVIPLVIMLASISLYERLATVLNRNIPGKGNIFKPLKRISLGLLLASGSMAVAAVIEVKRRDASRHNITISVFWLAWQYLLLGVSDMLTLGGMLEFFYSEAPGSMRSMCTALAWCSTSMGYFLSSILVSVVNSVSRRGGRQWLGGTDLNQNRLDLFYTLLCVLNLLNFLNYVYWAKRY